MLSASGGLSKLGRADQVRPDTRAQEGSKRQRGRSALGRETKTGVDLEPRLISLPLLQLAVAA